MTDAVWSNILSATDQDNAFAEQLGLAVANDGSTRGGVLWFMGMVSQFLRDRGQGDQPWDAYDFAICDWQALCRSWPVMIMAGSTPELARFVCERLPAVWDSAPFERHKPVTRALVMADRADTLVTMFQAGLKPNGSKDPYALRRAAKHFLFQVISPATVGHKAAA